MEDLLIGRVSAVADPSLFMGVRDAEVFDVREDCAGTILLAAGRADVRGDAWAGDGKTSSRRNRIGKVGSKYQRR